jgi:hypothetical protein
MIRDTGRSRRPYDGLSLSASTECRDAGVDLTEPPQHIQAGLVGQAQVRVVIDQEQGGHATCFPAP